MSDSEGNIVQFEVAAPKSNVTKTWCIDLVNSLKAQFEDMRERFTDLKLSFREDIKSSESILLAKIEEVKNEAQDAKKLAQANRVAIEKLQLQYKSDYNDIRSECNALIIQNSALKEQCNSIETYSRRNNIIIRGVQEPNYETGEQCEQSARLFLTNTLKISQDIVGAMVFVRCHRLRANRKKTTRDIIIRFKSFKDRDIVWGKKTELFGNKQFGMSEDFPKEVAANRKKLYLIFHRAKKMNLKVSLKADKLYIEGIMYTVNSLEKLPLDLQPLQFCEKSNEHALVFGGTLSEWHPFSNWSPVPMRYNGIKYISLEHAYLHTMATSSGDMDTAAAILASPDAQTAKMLSHKISGLDRAQWDRRREAVMEELLRIKFAPGTERAKTLLATGNKRLAETGKGDFYPCGMSITDTNILDISKWNVNALGKLLGKIRHELRD